MHGFLNQANFRRSFVVAGLYLTLALPAAAQQYPFRLEFFQGGSSTSIANNATLTFVAQVGQTQSLQIRATYLGTGDVSIEQQPSVLGSSVFTASPLDRELPVTLAPGGSVTFTVRYSPVSAATSSALLRLPFTEDPSTGAAPIGFTLQGLSSSLVVSYILPTDQNVVPVADGGEIPFPETLAGASLAAALNVTNLGSGPGQLSRLTISGSAFRLQGVPLLPAVIPSGGNVQVQVVYRPTATGEDTGTLTIETTGAAPITLRLTGRGVAPRLTYRLTDPAEDVAPGGTIQMPSVEIGESSTRLLVATNLGTSPAAVTTVGISGGVFQVTRGPVLPVTLNPGENTTFTLAFTPGQTAPSSGTLIVNSDQFELTGSGLGPQLSFSYVASGETISVGPTTPMIFSPVQISQSSELSLLVRNTGTTSALVSNIGIQPNGSAFSLPSPPVLPVRIAPNDFLVLPVRFEPTAVGFTTAAVAFNALSIPLSGSGTEPPALPSYTISGVSGTMAPFTQPSVGLKLDAPYPVALTGVLTLNATAGPLPADPAVQFASGGRTVVFRIPANTTDAIFGSSPAQSLGTQIGLQTGTAAGTFTLTPSFATQAAGVDVTPASPASAQYTVATVAPSLVLVQITGVTATSFAVEVGGFTTTRSLTNVRIQFTTASGFKMPQSDFTIDLRQSGSAWFQSSASQAFGGQFRAVVPFTFQLPADQSVINGIRTVSVTASNDIGTSAVYDVQLQ